MADIITVADLPATIQTHELVQTMVDGANAKASRVAPCLASSDPAPTEEQLAEARLVLIGAVKRWVDAGSGALQAQQVGPFGLTVDTRQRTGFNLWPSEISELQAICSTGPTTRRAFEVDTMPATAGVNGVYGVDYVWISMTETGPVP